MFQYLVYFLNIVGIVVHGFMIGFTSKWADENIGSVENRLKLTAIFEVKFQNSKFLTLTISF